MTLPTDRDRVEQLTRIMTEAKRLAVEYRQLTGRPLGITGEVGECEAVRFLNLALAPVRQSGFDAVGNDGTRYQIKTRCIWDNSKTGQRLGGIKREHEWDAVLLVILDGDLEPVIIHEASRQAVEQAILAPGSRSRNERGALSVSKFKSLGHVVWRISSN